MTSDMEIESVGTEKDYRIVDIIQETQDIQGQIRKEKEKRKKN